MTDAKPKALQLVEESENGDWIVGTGQWREEAAAELRRLHEENTALRQAIREHAMYEVQRLGQEIEQEPIAWMSPSWIDPNTRGWQSDSFESIPIEGWLPIYTTPPQRTEQNFCPRCGKRTNDIHTCTPPQRSESSGKPSAWVGLTNEELTDLFYNTNLGQQSAVSQAVALLKQKNT
jgi:hypothetical protein